MSTYQVRSLEEASQIIREHERRTKTSYSLLRSTKNFGCLDVPTCSNDENEVRFETVGVPYCGVPFFVAGLKILQCQSYKGRGIRKKRDKDRRIKVEVNGTNTEGNESNRVEESHEEDYPLGPLSNTISKKRKKNGRPQQVGCTATIIMKEVIYYPEFQLYEHSKNHRMANARQLKDTLKAKAPVQKDRIIYVTVPAPSDHFGHHVGMPISKNPPSKKVYIKNDFYGNNEPGPSKKVYYPVKQEKTNTNPKSKRLKVEEDDTEANAKDVRDVLQSIMGLTYKPGTTVAFQELRKNLLSAKLTYEHMMDNLLSSAVPATVASGGGGGATTVACVEVNHGPITTFTPTHQLLTVHPTHTKASDEPHQTVTMATGWQHRVNTSIPVVAVATLPISTTGVVTSPITVQAPTTGANNQESSIFIEAMEAIFNSQM